TCALSSCNSGYGNCDGDPANGCETSLTTTTDCGACGAVCALPNASSSCSTGTCALSSCNSGYGDCDGNAANGCETPLDTTTNCGTCSNACSTSNGTAACTSGACTIACTNGFGNCDGAVSNGCETNLNTNVSNCATCGHVCTFASASATCFGGVCQIGACNAGSANCDGNTANGCETALNTLSNC